MANDRFDSRYNNRDNQQRQNWRGDNDSRFSEEGRFYGGRDTYRGDSGRFRQGMNNDMDRDSGYMGGSDYDRRDYGGGLTSSSSDIGRGFTSEDQRNRHNWDMNRGYGRDSDMRAMTGSTYDSDYGTTGSTYSPRYGTSGSIYSGSESLTGMSHAGKGPKGWRRSDENIKEQVCDALERESAVDATEIDVTVKEGIVTLAGKVDHRSTKRRAEDCVERIAGVKDVRNELSVDQSFFQQAKEMLMGEGDSTDKQVRKGARH